MTFSHFACPLCQSLLRSDSKPWCCENGHSFDVARQGYVNLLPVQFKKSKSPGDSKEMVEARRQFLTSGIYQPIADFMWQQLNDYLSDCDKPVVLDAGCGEGYYLNYLSQRLNEQSADFIGLDISKPAVQKAAASYKHIQWVVGSNRHLPVEPHSLDVILCMFGFACFDVFAKALKPGGVVLMLDPGPDHLIELRRLIYSDIKEKSEPSSPLWQQEGFELVQQAECRHEPKALSTVQLQQLMLMTPHFFRAPKDKREQAAQLLELSITIDVRARVLKKV